MWLKEAKLSPTSASEELHKIDRIVGVWKAGKLSAKYF